MTLLRKGAGTKPPQPKPRIGPFTRLERLWHIILGSLVLDPFLVMLAPARVYPDRAVQWAIIAAIILLPFLAQESLYRAMAGLRAVNAKHLEARSFLIPLVAGSALALLVTVKLLPLGHLSGMWGLILFTLIAVVTIQGIGQAVKKAMAHSQALRQDAWSRLEQWENQLVVLSLAPLIIARSISAVGALAQKSEAQWAHFLPLFVVSLIFLGMLRPSRRLFMGYCKKCRQPVPIVFVDIGGCLQCDDALRAAYQNARHR